MTQKATIQIDNIMDSSYNILMRKMYKKKCIVCGKNFSISNKYGKKRINNRKYCSLACYHKTDNYKKTIFKNGHLGFPGKSNPMWRGGRSINKVHKNSYIRISIGKKKYRYEHRLVMEKYLGRKLRKKECVHHIDGDGTNNKISNLMLFLNVAAHIKFHAEYKRKNGRNR